jgi:hypothetical protein
MENVLSETAGHVEFFHHTGFNNWLMNNKAGAGAGTTIPLSALLCLEAGESGRESPCAWNLRADPCLLWPDRPSQSTTKMGTLLLRGQGCEVCDV